MGVCTRAPNQYYSYFRPIMKIARVKMFPKASINGSVEKRKERKKRKMMKHATLDESTCKLFTKSRPIEGGGERGGDNETKRNETKGRWRRRILDRRTLREPCGENESHVDANVIISREESWQVSSNRITPIAISFARFSSVLVTGASWKYVNALMRREPKERKG